MDYILPVATHNAIIEAAYRKRGYTAEEASQAARFCEMAAWHGIKTHNAAQAAASGADVLVAGSAIFGSSDYAATIRTLRG